MKNGPYELVVAPNNYPGKKYRGRYAYEHHVVWWKKTGRVVPKGYLVHHKNDNKRDNRFRNLALMSTTRHTSHHHIPAKMTVVVCAWCKEKFNKNERHVRYRRKIGQRRFYCCRSHQVTDQQRRRKLFWGSP